MATVEAATAAVFMSPSASPTAPGPGGGSSAESLIQHARQRNETAPAQADEEQEEDDHSLVPIGAAYLGATRASLRSASRSPGYNYHHHRSTGRSIAAQQQQEEEDLATADLRTVFDPATCAKRGRVAVPARVVPWHPVASKRKQNQNQKYNKAQRIMRSNGNGTENTTAAEEEAEHEGAEETFRIYYEVHGHGPKRMVFVMGLNMACFGWLPQVEYFASKPDEYSVLIFDQRGYGNSQVPRGRYTTSQMALDILSLLASPEVGWLTRLPGSVPAFGPPSVFSNSPRTKRSSSGGGSSAAASLAQVSETDIAPADARAFHIVGVSMGGMIALELAKRYAPLLKSLTLISTTSGRAYGAADVHQPGSMSPSGEAGGKESETCDAHESHAEHLVKRFATGLPPLRGVSAIARVMGGRLLGIDSDAFRIKKFTTLLFPAQWLDEPCEVVARSLEALRARGVSTERLPHAARVPSNRQWFAETFQWRYRYTHRQALPGALAQIAATLTHRVSNAELRHNIDAHVPRTLVLTGDDDNLVNPDNSRHLLANMPRARLVRLTGGGHALNMQFPARVNRLIEENVNEGEDLVAQGGW